MRIRWVANPQGLQGKVIGQPIDEQESVARVWIELGWCEALPEEGGVVHSTVDEPPMHRAVLGAKPRGKVR